MCRLSKESDSDATTKSIDWFELKCAVDKEQSLPCKLLPLSLLHVAVNPVFNSGFLPTCDMLNDFGNFHDIILNVSFRTLQKISVPSQAWHDN